jgi:hypothetical protein
MVMPKTYIENYERNQSGLRLAVSPEDGAEQWVEGRIRQSGSNLMTLMETITPVRAAALLARNPSNRTVSRLKVKKIARDMAAGRWRLNGETIIVATDGHLNDGQHRILAIIESGVTIDSNVAWGADRSSRMTVDAGSRDADDYLTMHGHPNGSLMGAVARLDLAYSSGVYWDHNVVLTTTEITEHAVSISDEIQSEIKFCRRASAKDIGLQSSIIFATMLIRRKVGNQRTDHFVNAFLDGAGDAWWVDSPAYALRKRFLGDKATRVRVCGCEKVELLLRAWNFHVRGQKKVRAIPLQQSYPVIEG